MPWCWPPCHSPLDSSFGQGIIGVVPIKSSETNSHYYPWLSIDASRIKWFKIHILLLDFDWCPIEVTVTLHIVWTSFGSLGWIALPCEVSLLRKGWVETHFPQDPNSELFIWPTELHILFHLWGHERSRFVRSSLVNSRKNFLKIKKTSNYPCQNKPPVPEIPPDLSTSRKKPRGV